jgi:hypothetical protein
VCGWSLEAVTYERLGDALMVTGSLANSFQATGR